MNLTVRLILRVLVTLLLFFTLTITTQVGGLFLLAGLFMRQHLSTIRSWVFTLGLYVLSVFTVIPLLASLGNRQALPLSGNLRPLNLVTCLLNRHYVKSDILMGLRYTADQMEQKYPGCMILYLDANFPFFNGFPLLPHLSHNDGKKIDLSFQYDLARGGFASGTPSPIGYGYYESPKKGETNYEDYCASKGYWQYGFIGRLVPTIKEAFS
ncbi:MAG: hypothetical protein AAFO69_14220 [Bacteroidota bacterium]